MIKSYLTEQFVKSVEVETTKTEINEFCPGAEMKFLSLASKTIFNWRSSKRTIFSSDRDTVKWLTRVKHPQKSPRQIRRAHIPHPSIRQRLKCDWRQSKIYVKHHSLSNASRKSNINCAEALRRFKLCRVIKPPGNWGCERAALCERELGT